MAIPTLATADQTDDLADLSTAELLAAVAEAEPAPLSGTAVYTARLGLPALPAELTQGADPINLLDGSSTIRVWTDGQERSRVSLLGSTSEYSVVTAGTEMWSYSSATNEVQHTTLDAQSQQYLDQAVAEHESATADGDIPTPMDLAEQILADAGEHAEISLADPVMVAGHAAYQLVVDPSTADTLVEQIVVAVDGATFVPLSVQVWSTEDGDTPAVELAFTDISFATPSDASLTFSTPSGATVTEEVIDLSEFTAQAPQDGAHPDGDSSHPSEGVTVTGSGFSSVIEMAGFDASAMMSADASTDSGDGTGPFGPQGPPEDMMEEFGGADGIDVAALYDQVTTPIDGGRLVTSTLFTILITDDGRLLAGAVPAQVLLETAGLT